MIGKRRFPNWREYGRVMVLIDNANVIHALSTLDWKLDHRKLKDYFERQTKLQGTYLYSAFIKTHAAQQSFLEMLSRMGYTLRTKEVKFIRQKDGSFVKKGDLDIEIAIDLFEGLKKFDTAILLSGDSDFAPLVEYIKSKGKKVIVISTRPHISRELARVANLFIDLGKFQRYWQLKGSSS